MLGLRPGAEPLLGWGVFGFLTQWALCFGAFLLLLRHTPPEYEYEMARCAGVLTWIVQYTAISLLMHALILATTYAMSDAPRDGMFCLFLSYATILLVELVFGVLYMSDYYAQCPMQRVLKEQVCTTSITLGGQAYVVWRLHRLPVEKKRQLV